MESLITASITKMVRTEASATKASSQQTEAAYDQRQWCIILTLPALDSNSCNPSLVTYLLMMTQALAMYKLRTVSGAHYKIKWLNNPKKSFSFNMTLILIKQL